MKNTKKIEYLGNTYTREFLNECRQWVKDCEWGEGYSGREVDRMSDITILAGVDRNWDGGLKDAIVALTPTFRP